MPQYKPLLSSYQAYVLNLLFKHFPTFSDKISALLLYADGAYNLINTERAAGQQKSDLPSSDKYVYSYVLRPPTLRGEVVAGLPSNVVLRTSNITGVPVVEHAFIPTLADVIGLIPFIPIEINVPNVISSVITFFNWVTNRRPQEQSNPRIYLLLRNHR